MVQLVPTRPTVGCTGRAAGHFVGPQLRPDRHRAAVGGGPVGPGVPVGKKVFDAQPRTLFDDPSRHLDASTWPAMAQLAGSRFSDPSGKPAAR
jgi:hypothetical protein